MELKLKIDFIFEDFEDKCINRQQAVNKVIIAAEREIKEKIKDTKLYWFVLGIIAGLVIGFLIF